MTIGIFKRTAFIAALAAIGSVAHAAEWSDSALSERVGQNFCEPYNGCKIGKHIFNFTNVSGYAYGTNFFSVDMLDSDAKDPGVVVSSGNAASPAKVGSQEAYAVYRNTVDFSKFTSTPLSYGYIRSLGATAGFDWNTKNNSYSSKKQMEVVGPTVMFNVPGFLNFSILELYESNYPSGTTATSRYNYKPHTALDAAFGIPFSIGPAKFSFEGYMDYIDSKGKLELNAYNSQPNSARETHFDGRVMYDASDLVGAKAKTFQVGVEYEFWKNKFGNAEADSVAAGYSGTRASTPMIRGEYHF